jgi:ABC-type transport system involved in cytochrome c biogenesis permease subunit
MSSATLTILAFALYLGAVVCYGALLWRYGPPGSASPGAGLVRFGRPLLFGGIAVQVAAIGMLCVSRHSSPFASDYGTLAVTAWAIALAFAALDIRYRIPAVGGPALLVACLVLCWAVTRVNAPVAESRIIDSQVVSLHVLLYLSSLGLFVVAFGCAALYLVQNRLLKAHRMNSLFRRLPPLETLDTLAFQSAACALPLLTAGIAAGVVRAFGGGLALPPSAWILDGRTLWVIGVWLVYLFYLLARVLAGWRGVRLQYILLVGLPCAIVLYAIPTRTHHFH